MGQSSINALRSITALGQRNPTSLDSARASSLVTPQLALSFRARLPAASRPSFFTQDPDPSDHDAHPESGHGGPEDERHDAGLGLPGSSQAVGNGPRPAVEPREQHDYQRHLASQYPICLFLDFPELPPIDAVKELVDHALQRFVDKMPFLDALRLLFSANKLPKHFTFALAALGATLSDSPLSAKTGASLWQAAVYVHSACAEVDNRHARRVDWIMSVRCSLRRPRSSPDARH